MNVGFTITLRGTTAHLAVTRPQGRDSLLSHAHAGSAAAVLMGRLHYRGDLRRRLARPTGLNASDAELALAVYRELGSEGLERIEGDFALVVWDGAAQRIVALRDPLGGYPLFWTSASGTFALGTSLAPLLDILGSRRLNRGYLADYLTTFGQRNEGANTDCVYEGLHRILPRTIVTLAIPTQTLTTRRYWDWADRIRSAGTDRPEEVAELYRAELRASVETRMEGPTLAHLSGGMDSTAVALLGRELVREGRTGGPLHTLSLVYDRLPKLSVERPFIEAVLKGLTDVIVHRLPADDLLDFDAFVDAPALDEPYPGLWRLQMHRATIEETRRVGATTMLTGVGADEVLDVQPYFLADLLRQGRFLKAWQVAGQWAHAKNTSKWSILGTFGIAPLGWPTWGLGWLKGLDEQGVNATPPWIQQEFSTQFGLAQRAQGGAQAAFRRCPGAVKSLMVNTLESETGDPLRWSLAAPLGVAVAHPFLDPRVLTLGMGIQTRRTPQPGRMKPLLADAVRNLLPPAVLDRPGKGHFDEVYYRGFARNLDHLERMVREAPIDDLGIFNKEILVRQMEEASMAGPNARQLFPLDLSLGLVHWLAYHREWHRQAVAPDEVIAWGDGTAHEPARA